MAQLLQLKRRIPGTGAPGALAAGEPAVAISATGAAGHADLFVGDGGFVHELVSANRQVELAGAQIIVGAKTFGATGGATGSLTIPVDELHIGGGTGGYVLSTDGAGDLDWIEPPKGVETGAATPATGDLGDLFYNTTTRKLMVYNGTAWEVANSIFVATAATAYPSTPVAGSARFNTDTHQFLVYDGTTWQASTGNRSYFTAGPTGPAGAHANGDIWWSDIGPHYWDGSAWVLAEVGTGVTRFFASETYVVGDLVAHNGIIYRAIAGNGPGAFDGDDWEQITDVSPVFVGTAGPTGASPGDLFYNTTTHKLLTWNGTTWEIVGNRSYDGATAPTAPHSVADIWWSPSGPQYWDGMAWHRAVIAGVSATAPAGPAGTTGNLYFNTASGDLMVHNGTGWVTTASAMGLGDLEIDDPLVGDGLSPATALSVAMATTGQIGGVAPLDDVFPISSEGLRSQIGGTGGAASLNTTAKQVVPAINELRAELQALSGALRLVGTYDVAADEVTPTPASAIPVDDPLPEAVQANRGWFVIVHTAGTGSGEAPTVPIAVGDWLVSDGSDWIHVPAGYLHLVASNVGITTINAQVWTNVQAALEGLYALASGAVATDGVSIIGPSGATGPLGSATNPIQVGVVDGGVF